MMLSLCFVVAFSVQLSMYYINPMFAFCLTIVWLMIFLLMCYFNWIERYLIFGLSKLKLWKNPTKIESGKE